MSDDDDFTMPPELQAAMDRLEARLETYRSLCVPVERLLDRRHWEPVDG